MGTCKTCEKKCEGDYCFQHKPRKPLPFGKGLTSKKPFKPKKKLLAYRPKGYKTLYEEILIMRNFFLEIWNKRPHKSEISGDYLGKEAMSTYFHHILPKNKYPEASLDEENIILLTLEEHESVEFNIYKYEEINKRRDALKIKYKIL